MARRASPAEWGKRPAAAGPWGVTTQRGSTVYVHVLDWNGPVLALPAMPRPVHAARLLRDGSIVEFSAVKGGLVLKLPEPRAEEVDRVIVLELEACLAPDLLDTELSVFMPRLRGQGAAGELGLA